MAPRVAIAPDRSRRNLQMRATTSVQKNEVPEAQRLYIYRVADRNKGEASASRARTARLRSKPITAVHN